VVVRAATTSAAVAYSTSTTDRRPWYLNTISARITLLFNRNKKNLSKFMNSKISKKTLKVLPVSIIFKYYLEKSKTNKITAEEKETFDLLMTVALNYSSV